ESLKTADASEKLTPCLARLAAAFCSSHSKSSMGDYGFPVVFVHCAVSLMAVISAAEVESASLQSRRLAIVSEGSVPLSYAGSHRNFLPTFMAIASIQKSTDGGKKRTMSQAPVGTPKY